MRAHWSGEQLSGIGAAYFDVAEARGAGSVAGPDHLLGLAFAAIGNAPEHPLLAIGDGFARIPELGRDAAVGGILQHAYTLAVADLPGYLTSELEIVAFVVDGPALIRLHVDGVIDSAEYLI